MRKLRRGSEEHLSTDEESDTDYSVDYDYDNTSLLHDTLPSSTQRNGVCAENSRPVDGLANDVKGPCFW